MSLRVALRARTAALATLCAFAPAAVPAVSEPGPAQRLSFDVVEGLNINSFLRDGKVAAHLLLRSGLDPRIVVAFPAGNSGVGLWFSHAAQSVTWSLIGRPEPIVLEDARGRPLYGITAEVSASGAAALHFSQAVLSSVRILRNFQADGTLPVEVTTEPVIADGAITWARDRLDGAAGYRLSIRVTHGTLEPDRITAAADEVIRLEITAVTGETPLVPLSGTHLLNATARQDLAARDALTFLSYREAFLAGSWRFNTYFGRDTLMSVRLLMPALTPEAVDAGLGAVLTRLSPQGEVAHEENVGEFAVLEHLQAGIHSDAPTFDYKMIDGTFMLAPVAADWLLNDERGRAEAREFLARPDGRYGQPARTLGADLVSNLRFVIGAAMRFADDPRAENLIALKPGSAVGQWRDSTDGLAGGRIPYDVNAVFVPAALEAAGRFLASGLLDPFLAGADRSTFARAATMTRIWRAQARPMFDVTVPSRSARASIIEYAAALQIPDGAALRSVDAKPVRFHALALTAFRRRRRIAVRPAAPGRPGAGRDGAGPAISGGPLDPGRNGGGESGIRGAGHPGDTVAQRLPWHRHLVLAAGGSRRRSRSSVAAARSRTRPAQAGARGAVAALARDPRRLPDAQFGTLVVELRKRPISNRAVRHQHGRRGRVERRAIVEHGLSGPGRPPRAADAPGNRAASTPQGCDQLGP
jgi:hypothetical protein